MKKDELRSSGDVVVTSSSMVWRACRTEVNRLSSSLTLESVRLFHRRYMSRTTLSPSAVQRQSWGLWSSGGILFTDFQCRRRRSAWRPAAPRQPPPPTSQLVVLSQPPPETRQPVAPPQPPLHNPNQPPVHSCRCRNSRNPNWHYRG